MRRPRFDVYLVGVVVFGLTYQPVRDAIGNDPLWFAACIAYLLLLRLVAQSLGRRVHADDR